MSDKQKYINYNALYKYREDTPKQKKMKVKKQGKLSNLKLDKNYIEDIMRGYILPKYKGLTYNIKESQSTDSVYLEMFYGRASCCVRFSDHRTKKHIETLNSKEEIQAGEVITTIDNRAKGLQFKSKMMAFEEIRRLNKNEQN